MAQSRELFNELNKCSMIADRRTTNSMYASLKHSMHCLYNFKNNGWYDCYLQDMQNNVRFGVDSVCATPPIPCGYTRNGRTCLRITTHTHVTRNGTHTFISREDRQSDEDNNPPYHE